MFAAFANFFVHSVLHSFHGSFSLWCVHSMVRSFYGSYNLWLFCQLFVLLISAINRLPDCVLMQPNVENVFNYDDAVLCVLW